jgi:hypothetical protein
MIMGQRNTTVRRNPAGKIVDNSSFKHAAQRDPLEMLMR